MAEIFYSVTVDGSTKEYPAGTTYLSIAEEVQNRYEHEIVLVFVDGFHLQELAKTVQKDCALTFVTTADAIGHEAYKRSMCFLLVKAVHDVAGHDRIERVRIHFSLDKGYYCTVEGGVELTEEYVVSNNTDGTDTYQISLFNGMHTITAAVPWCEVYEGEFDTSADGSIMVENLTLTDTGKTALQAKMQEALESLYTSAMADDDFSAVSDLFAENAAAEYEDTYNDLRDRLTDDPDDHYTLNQIAFDDFRCSFYAESGTISGEMDCDYTVDYTYTYSGFGSSRTENETNDGSAYVGATFVYEGDTYKLQYVNIPNVWWY